MLKRHLQYVTQFSVLLSLIVSASLAGCSFFKKPGLIYNSFPTEVSPGDHYIIYLHGKIIEDQGIEQPTSPQFGEYKYKEILAAFSDEGLQVISEVRLKNTNALQYAHRLAGKIQVLLDAGVPPEQITIVGVSKGGAIAILTSDMLQNDRLKFVLLAGCNIELLESPQISIAGRVLSIFEASDDLSGSCQPLFDRASATSIVQEIRLETGLGHGEFYRPWPRWVEPSINWALGQD
jgi:hypothetical protein